MKRAIIPFALFATIAILGCEKLFHNEETNKKGSALSFSINAESLYDYVDDIRTKNILLTLDTNKFLLKIYSSDGIKIYDGKYAERPATMNITKGTYDIELLSSKFTGPQFDSPLVGEKKTIVVGDAQKVHISFNCKQLNCGLRLTFDKGFIAKFPGTGVRITQNNKTENYRFSEKRYIYLNPTLFEVHAWSKGVDTLLLERSLAERQMMELKLSYASGLGRGVSVSYECDTSRLWLNGELNIGFTLPAGCLTIPEAQKRIGESNIMVFGYIYGGDPTTNSVRVAPPFTSRTSIVIAPNMKVRNRNLCIAVELPSGTVRDGLNLVVNPELIGSPVVVCGNVVDSYYGYVGLKGTKRYILL